MVPDIDSYSTNYSNIQLAKQPSICQVITSSKIQRIIFIWLDSKDYTANMKGLAVTELEIKMRFFFASVGVSLSI